MTRGKTDPTRFLQDALGDARIKLIPAGQIILYEGDRPQEVFILKSGIVKLYDIDDQGNEKILHLAGPPAVIPLSFFSQMVDPLRWFYATVTDCEVYTMPYTELSRLTEDSSRLAKSLTRAFSDDVHELLVRLSSLSKSNSHDKVVAALRFLLVRHTTKRRAGWHRVIFPINHQLIADLCGVTRESAALVMKELSDGKVVRNPKTSILEISHKKLGQLPD